jgi:hypothetical protein
VVTKKCTSAPPPPHAVSNSVLTTHNLLTCKSKLQGDNPSLEDKCGHWTPNILCRDLVYIRQHVSAVTKIHYFYFLSFFGFYNTNNTVNFKSQSLKFYCVLYTSDLDESFLMNNNER